MSQEREPPELDRARCTGTLDALLRLHQDSQRGLLFIHLGDALIERLAGHVEGYRACMRESGFPDGGYERFRDWLRHVKQAPPVEEQPDWYLRDCHGDHERAIREYLDLVAEFTATSSREDRRAVCGKDSSASGGEPRPQGILPYLLRLRQDPRAGRHPGLMNAERLNTFVDGYNACMEDHGLPTDEYVRFRDWLRDVKQALPGEGWPAAYLRDCQGDHERAIRKYLDLVAEFANPPSE